MENKKQKSTSKWALLILLIASLLTNVYLVLHQQSVITAHGNQLDSLIQVRMTIEKELTNVSLELNQYKGIASNLDSLLSDANGQIKLKEQQIRKLLASESNINQLNKKLKASLAELNQLKEEYLEKIDVLLSENKALKQQNDSLNTNINQLHEQKNLLTQKLNVASQLKVEYVQVQSYKKKSNGNFVENVLAKKTNKLEVCFKVMQNKVAPTGDKMLYLRILAPNGKVLMGYTKTVLNNPEGSALDMTSSIKLEYKGETEQVCLAYENQERILESGTYLIELYIENEMVHQSNYLLK